MDKLILQNQLCILRAISGLCLPDQGESLENQIKESEKALSMPDEFFDIISKGAIKEMQDFAAEWTAVKKSDTYKFKKINIQFGEHFSEWFENFLNASDGRFDRFDDLRSKFLNEYGLSEKDFSAIRFSKALRVSAKFFGKTIVYDKNKDPRRLLYVKMVSGID